MDVTNTKSADPFGIIRLVRLLSFELLRKLSFIFFLAPRGPGDSPGGVSHPRSSGAKLALLRKKTGVLECQSWLALWTYTASAIEYSDPLHFPRKHRGGMGAAL